MNRFRLLILGFALAASLLGVEAQERVVSLSLQQAKDTALVHNRQLQNASYDVKIAEMQRWQAISSMLPQVSAGYDYQNTMGYKMELNMGGMHISKEIPASGNFNITAAIALSGQQIVGALISKVATDMQDINRMQTEQTVMANTTKLYMSALANQQVLALLDSNKNNIERVYQSTKEAVRVGVVEQTEADKIYVQVMKLRSAITSAKQGVELLYNSLKLQLGLPAETKLVLTDNLDNLTNAEKSLELLHTDFDMNNNYTYRLLGKNLELSKKQVALAASAYSPTLTMAYRFSNIKYFGGEPMMSTNPPHALSVSVKLPFFTSGRTFTAIKEKKYSYLKLKNTYDDATNQLQIQNKQLRFNLNTAYENFQIQKENIRVSQSVFQSVTEKFRYGKASSLEVTQASSELIAAQSAYIQALIEMTNAQIELRNLLNK